MFLTFYETIKFRSLIFGYYLIIGACLPDGRQGIWLFSLRFTRIGFPADITGPRLIDNADAISITA
jgi:hypothetical protein